MRAPLKAEVDPGADLGIDLGTTFSVIAVPGRVSTVAGFPPAKYLERCDVSILPAPSGEYLIPSIVGRDPQSGQIVVGTEARKLAEVGHPVVMFSKRSIGTTEPLRLWDGTITAREAATHILKYLKHCAEQALGRPVRRAVVTHPAYFLRNQVEETRQAAVDAGLEMTDDEQMLMEPIAATGAYIHRDPRDPLRVMTYDLGGGTFDLTVMQRVGGVTEMIAYDGDHLLGGYNFDRLLVEKLLKQVRAAGHVFSYDEEDPADRGRRARLLRLAEQTKLALAQKSDPDAPYVVSAPDILVDRDGKPIPIVSRITRAEYVALIAPLLTRTLDCSWRAIRKSLKLEPTTEPDRQLLAGIHTVILVGGSTHGPWVVETVRRAMGGIVEPYEPDLCVAAGAALRCAQLSLVGGGRGFNIFVSTSPVSPLPTTTVAGQLRTLRGEPLSHEVCEGLAARLEGPDGVSVQVPVSPQATFFFEDVALQSQGATPLSIRVEDETGRPLVSRQFEIRYLPDGAVESVTTVLPRALHLRAANGLLPIADEGASLPTQEFSLELLRLFNEPDLEVPVVQDGADVGRITIRDIPRTAGEGAPVRIRMHVTGDNKVVGTAEVLNPGGSVAARCEVDIRFPPLRIPSLAELKALRDRLEDQRQQMLDLSGNSPVLRTRLTATGGRIVKDVDGLLNELEPDKQEVFRALRELERLVEPERDVMDPPLTRFRDYVRACTALIASRPTDPEVQSYAEGLGRISGDGEKAHSEKNHKRWALENGNIEDLYTRLRKVVVDEKVIPTGPTPTIVQKREYMKRVSRMADRLKLKRDDLRGHAQFETRIAPRALELSDVLKAMHSAIEAIPDETDPGAAWGQLELAVRREADTSRKIEYLDGETWSNTEG